MKASLTTSPTPESINRIELADVKMISATPRWRTINRLFHTVLMALALSFLFGAAAQAEKFQNAKGGMKIKDIQTGTGLVAAEGTIATIHFTAWLDQQGVRGRELYNSRNSGEPVSFVIGTDKVMPAWNEGVRGMQIGGIRQLLVPPEMAYGQRAVDDVIPAGASMQFIIELVRLEE